MTVTVTSQAAATDAGLSALAVTHGAADTPVALTPGFSTDIVAYAGSVAPGVSRVTLSATPRQATAPSRASVEWRKGSTVLSDASSTTAGFQADLARGTGIAAGVNALTARVTAPDGTTTRDYALALARRSATRLAALSLTGPKGRAGALHPAFSADTADYTAVAPHGAATVTVAARAQTAGATVAITPADADGIAGNGHQVALDAAPSATTVTVRTTGPGGRGTGTYTVTVSHSTAGTDLCERTPEVRDAIVALISGVTDCAAVTAAQLAAVRKSPLSDSDAFDLSDKDITALKAGDFAGLTGVTRIDLSENELTSLPAGLFAGLTGLDSIVLNDNDLTSLPAGLFRGLSGLQQINLGENELTSLPAGLFDGLTELLGLLLHENRLASLPAGIFDDLAKLEELSLYGNRLTALRADVFSGLVELHALGLDGNLLSTLPPGLFDHKGRGHPTLTLDLSDNRLTELPEGLFRHHRRGTIGLHDNPGSARFRPPAEAGPDLWVDAGAEVRLDASASEASGPWLDNVAYTWTQLDEDGEALAADHAERVALEGETTSRPTFTAPSAKRTLRFRVTVTGRGARAPTEEAPDPPGRATDTVLVRVAAVDTDAALDSLELAGSAGGAIALGFSPQLTSYAPTAHRDDATVTVRAAPAVRAAAVDITPADADPVADGHQVRLAPGATTAVTVTVTAKDARTVRRYAVAVRRPATDVCARTPAVRTAIVAAVSGASHCRDVTDAQLAAVTSLSVASTAIAALAAGDFSGMSALATLDLSDNRLATLPDGLFAGLDALSALDLSDNRIATLPDGLFAGLDALSALDLSDNRLAAFPPDLAGPFAALATLDLSDNRIAALPPGAFDGKPELARLRLDGNRLGSLRDGALAALPALDELRLAGNPGHSGGARFAPHAYAGADRTVAKGETVVLDGRASARAGPWLGNVTWAWVQVDQDDAKLSDTDPDLVTLTDPDTATPAFTASPPSGCCFAL